MDRIPLYNPLASPSPPMDLSKIHWKDMAEQLEARAVEFFNLPSYLGVLAVDRATHGIGLPLEYFREQHGAKFALIPQYTYRAVPDAALSAGLHVAVAKKGETEGELKTGGFDRDICKSTVMVPTTLGGTELQQAQMPEGTMVVYDCAHTCHPHMFDMLEFGPNQVAVTSHFPTKPCGAYGGGLVIGRRGLIEQLRPAVWPVNDQSCAYCYPQTIQSWGIMHRFRTFSAEHWEAQCNCLYAVRKYLPGPVDGLELVWPYRGCITPHLLTFKMHHGLQELCVRANIETGNHYPSIAGKHVGDEHLTVPFHTTEVIDRLKEVL